MSEIASYKTRGTIVVTGLNPDDDGTGVLITEWRFPDRYRLLQSGVQNGTGEEGTMELRWIGSRWFVRNVNEDWRLQPESSESIAPNSVFGAHLNLLNNPDIALISTTETTDSGTPVYRLEFDKLTIRDSGDNPDKPLVGQTQSETQLHTTLLIDQETFLYVTMIQESRLEFTLTTTKNGVPTFTDSWSETLLTYNYYDYDRPVSIEPPAEYTAWADLNAPPPTATPVPPANLEVTEGHFPLPDPGSTFMESLLDLIPVIEGEFSDVTLNNFEALCDYADIERPGPELDSEAALEAMRPMFVPPVAFEGPLLTRELPYLSGLSSNIGEDQFKYLGMDFRSVDQTAVLDMGGFELLVGEYSLERTTGAFNACEECIQPEIRTFDGVDYFSWDWKVSDGQTPPLFNAGTRRDNILVQDGLVVAASTPEKINAYIRTSNGQAPSLLETGDFALVANGMATLGAISAKFATGDFSRSAIVGGGLELEKVNMVDSGPLMRPFGMVAYGSGHDGSSQFTALVIAHESNALALINSKILIQRIREAVTSNREPWTDLIKSIEFEVNGRLLMARIYLHRKNSGFPLAFNPNHMPLLIVHE